MENRLFFLLILLGAISVRAQENDSIGRCLDEVAVTSTRVKVLHKNDTIVFDATAFNLPEGSMLDALIRQMPGVKLDDNGVVTVNGRKVDYLLLNGKDFFKGDNRAVLDNLPHYTVKNVRVYEKETEKSLYVGRSIEPRDYVMDVVLKREYHKSYLGNIETGVATSDRYMGRGFGSRFDKRSALSAYLNLNNINESRRPDSSGEWTPENAPVGKHSIKDFGATFTTDNERYKEVLDVNGKISDKWDASESRTTNFNTAGGLFRFKDSYSDNRERNFSINNTFMLKAPI